MWESNLRHGVQYTRAQRQTKGLKLHERGLTAKVVAQRVGVSASSVYSWTKEQREKERQERDAEIARLREEGMTQQEIADELGVAQGTIAKNIPDSKTGIWNKESERTESEAGSTIDGDEEETGEMPEGEEADERPVEEQADEPESESELETEEAPAEEEPDTQDQEPSAARTDTRYILNTARAVMGDIRRVTAG